jgi:hypothetical protein
MDLHRTAAVLIARRRLRQPGRWPAQQLGVQGLRRHVRQDSPGTDQAARGFHARCTPGVDEYLLRVSFQHDLYTVVLQEGFKSRNEVRCAAFHHRQPMAMHAQGHDRKHDAAGGLVWAEAGMEEPWGPQLICFPSVEPAAEVIAAAHHGFPHEGLGTLDFPSPQGTGGNLHELLEGPQFSAECTENGAGIAAEVFQHRQVRAFIPACLQSRSREHGIAVGNDDPQASCPGVDGHAGRHSAVGIAVFQTPGMQLTSQRLVSASRNEQGMPGGEGVVDETGQGPFR